MLTRRDFVRVASVGTAVALSPLRLRAAPAVTMDSLLAQLKTSAQLGVPYLHDSLHLDAPYPAALTVHTQLADPARCGRRADGWAVRGGTPDSYTWVGLREAPVLGNRSQWAQLSFRSTQTGIAADQHGLIELRLCRGATPDDLPLRVRVENGCFYILSLNGDLVLAGDRTTAVCPLMPDATYTLGVLLFAKAIFARLSGPGLPGGAVDLVVPDRRRFVPGRPGFGLRPSAQATGGELSVFDWQVTPVGPPPPCRLGAIGDSITAGNDMEPEAESYVHLATRELGQKLVLNTGSGGSTTALDLARLPFELAPFRPAIVWIESGTNDLGAGLGAEEIFRNLTHSAESVSWGGRVVFSTVPPRPLPNDEAYARLAELNRLIRASGRPCVDRYALVCDPANPHRLRPDLAKPDGIHINRDGHVLVAREAVRIFRSLT
jgi:lysophospholipase L1-like esterase